jgi:chaperonin cofactor prefoldin
MVLNMTLIETLEKYLDDKANQKSANILDYLEIDINSLDPYTGTTPLIEACGMLDLGLIHDLLSAGANPQIKSDEEISPLDAFMLGSELDNPEDFEIKESDEYSLTELLNKLSVNVDIDFGIGTYCFSGYFPSCIEEKAHPVSEWAINEGKLDINTREVEAGGNSLLSSFIYKKIDSLNEYELSRFKDFIMKEEVIVDFTVAPTTYGEHSLWETIAKHVRAPGVYEIFLEKARQQKYEPTEADLKGVIKWTSNIGGSQVATPGMIPVRTDELGQDFLMYYLGGGESDNTQTIGVLVASLLIQDSKTEIDDSLQQKEEGNERKSVPVAEFNALAERVETLETQNAALSKTCGDLQAAVDELLQQLKARPPEGGGASPGLFVTYSI